jgi:hypothetical protein
MKQISIICKNANPVTEITELLSSNGIDIRDINFQKMGSDAILTLVASDDDQCLTLLTAVGYTTLTEETLLLKAEDKPGMLAQISRGISDLGIDIRSMTLLDINDSKNVVAICTSDNDRVRELYRDVLIN